MIIYRERLADFFLKTRLPNFVVYLIASMPFMLFEENINCLPTGCKLIPPTIPFLFAFILILGLIVKYTKVKSLLRIIVGFSIFGIIIEYTVGATSFALQSLISPFGLFLAIWVGISYAYISLIPLTILLRNKNKK